MAAKKTTKKRGAKSAPKKLTPKKAAPKTKAGPKTKGGAKKPKPAASPKAKNAAAAVAVTVPLNADLQSRVEEVARAFADAKREEFLGRTGKVPETLPLTDFIVRQKVLEAAGEGRATNEERTALASVFKTAFANRWTTAAR